MGSEKLFWVREGSQVKVYNDKQELVEVAPVQRDPSGQEFAATSTVGLIILKPQYMRHKEILETRIKYLVQRCLENPELAVGVIEKFFQRNIKWDIIDGFSKLGKPVKCEICGQESVTGFWCKPCIHPNWCCYCCILLGIPGYG